MAPPMCVAQNHTSCSTFCMSSHSCWQARARRDAMMISVGVQCVLAACLMALAVAFSVDRFQDFSFALDGLLQSVGPIVASLIAAASSIGLSISSIQQWLRTPVSDSARIVEEVASGAIRQKLGFMHLIKLELDRIGAMLKNPKTSIPSFLDYLLPISLLHGRLHKALAWLCGVSQPDLQPCRMVIIVDDLDRCPADKLMEVLQSLVLLTEGTPFVIFLAIDQRVVVAAIETSGEGLYSGAGINGSEYLDKIVQIPFVIPQLADTEKADLCRGYLRPALARKASRGASNLTELNITGRDEGVNSRSDTNGVNSDGSTAPSSGHGPDISQNQWVGINRHENRGRRAAGLPLLPTSL